ncbi:zinc finger protein 260-like [Diaphorina citri]|uniref:Zinc finger protein 260-like n=1 Tax=Diaphorina citri TaxID=121845 RepID=A0A3Q0JCR8_DIACI|nr:zinc finger protein 260-like [Diaphorina citri]
MTTLTPGEEANNLDLSPDSGINDLQNLSPEEQEKQKAEWTQELARVEEEINTLKHVLASKTKTAQDLKKKLGFTVWKEFNDDLTQSIKNVKETQVFMGYSIVKTHLAYLFGKIVCFIFKYYFTANFVLNFVMIKTIVTMTSLTEELQEFNELYTFDRIFSSILLLRLFQEAYAVHCTEIHSKQPTSEPSQDVNYILSHMETYRQMPQQTIPVTPVLSNGVLVGALTNGVPVNSDDGDKGGDAQSKSTVVKSDLIKDPIASDDNMEDGYMDEPETDINPKEVIDTGKPESKSLHKCDRCPKKFSSLAKYNFHVSNHGVDKPFQCFKCEKRFRSKLGLDEHEAKHTGRYEYECNACGKGFQNKSYLIVHQRVHSTDKPYACKTCPRSFKTKQTLLDHENRHMGVKPYSCEICGRGFITKGLCKSHQKIHSGNDNRQYPCPVCKKLFVSKSYLNTHLRIHTGDKPFVCEHCNKGFLTKVDLKIHNTMHTGEKSFVCETCGKAFARRDALRCHTRSHTGERPYRCNICGQSFTQFSPMAIHKRLHTGERPYSCELCNKAFVSRSTLMVHKKKHTV